MTLNLQFKEISYSCHDYHDRDEGVPIHLENYVFEVQGNGTQGMAYSHHIRYEFDPDVQGNTPVLFRGFLHFVGTFNNYEGSFLAQEDGVCNPSGRQIRGRIVDCTDELITMTGSYEYAFQPTDKHRQLTSSNQSTISQGNFNDAISVVFEVEM